nr:retrovirus-related Pol polyprotein from transposon TNT 1-94 [Tanacetum cinerariifolium]
MAVINDLMALLKSMFEMKDLRAAKKILGMEIWRDRKAGRLWVSQEKYIEKVMQAFFVDQSKPVSTLLAAHFKLDRSNIPGTDKEVKYMKTVSFSSAVGSPMYARVCMRPDLAHAVSVVSRFMANPGKAHWKAVKWILRYLKGASNICLVYDGKGHGDGLVGYADSDCSGDLVKRRSLTCFIFTLYGCEISWKSTLQPVVALSTTKAKYMSMTEGGVKVITNKVSSNEASTSEGGNTVNTTNSFDALSKQDVDYNDTAHEDIVPKASTRMVDTRKYVERVDDDSESDVEEV